MNINQKIQFLRNRRHMDAMRIKKLKRRFGDASISKFFNEAKLFAEKLKIKYRLKGRAESKYNPLINGIPLDHPYPSLRSAANSVLYDFKHYIEKYLHDGKEYMTLRAFKSSEADLKEAIKRIKNDVSLTPKDKEECLKDANKLLYLIREAELSAKLKTAIEHDNLDKLFELRKRLEKH